MEKDAWQAFVQWLESASDDELIEKARRIEALREKLSDQDVIHDASRMIREIDRELLGRLV